MFRNGLVVTYFLCFFAASLLSQTSTKIDSAFVVGSWINAADPKEHYEFRADGQFSGEDVLDHRVEHLEGTWDLQENTLILHFAPFAAAKARWDGKAFVADDRNRYIKVISPLTVPSQSVASSSVAADADLAGNSMNADQKRFWQKILLWERLDSAFTVTKTTADKYDIVTAGSVVTLKKDGRSDV